MKNQKRQDLRGTHLGFAPTIELLPVAAFLGLDSSELAIANVAPVRRATRVFLFLFPALRNEMFPQRVIVTQLIPSVIDLTYGLDQVRRDKDVLLPGNRRLECAR